MASTSQTLAENWVATLNARGVQVRLRKNRLWLIPESAYKELTDDERATLRHNREAIKDVVRARAKNPPPPVAPTPTEPKRPIPEHILRVINYNTPEERKRRSDEATDVMLGMMGRRGPQW
jgi:hypothetical protein